MSKAKPEPEEKKEAKSAEDWFNEGNALYDSENYGQAIESYNKAISINKVIYKKDVTNVVVRDRIHTFLTKAADCLIKLGRMDDWEDYTSQAEYEYPAATIDEIKSYKEKAEIKKMQEDQTIELQEHKTEIGQLDRKLGDMDGLLDYHDQLISKMLGIMDRLANGQEVSKAEMEELNIGGIALEKQLKKNDAVLEQEMTEINKVDLPERDDIFEQRTKNIIGSITAEKEYIQQNRQPSLLKASLKSSSIPIVEAISANIEAFERIKEAIKKTEQLKQVKLDLKTIQEDELLYGYYDGFMFTCDQSYNTAQIVTSGQLSLDTGNLAVTIGTKLISLIPIIGDKISSPIEQIWDFLEGTQIFNASVNITKMSSTGEDFRILLQDVVIGIINNRKSELLAVKEEHVKVVNFIKKVEAFCKKIKVNIEESIYKQRFETQAQKLGNQEASDLIANLISNGKIYNNKKAISISVAEKKQILIKTVIDAAANEEIEAGSSQVPEEHKELDIQDQIETRIVNLISEQKLNTIHDKAGRGFWKTESAVMGVISGKGLSMMGKEIEEYLKESYIEGLLQKSHEPVTDFNITAVRKVIFKHICIGINQVGSKNLTCAVEFSNRYPDLTVQIAQQHPKYFIIDKIAASCVMDEALRERVIKIVKEGSQEIYILSEIVYDNPMLNHPEILGQILKDRDSEAVSKAIDLGQNLTIEELDVVLAGENAVQNIYAMLGFEQ